jgi:ABC-type sugar transport system substrate-binding protein
MEERKMKKLYQFAAVFGLIACLFTGCSRSKEGAGDSSTQEKAAGLPTVAVCLPSLDNPLMTGIEGAVKAKFAGIADVQVSSADLNNNTMAAQIQNYAAMKVNTLFVMPNDGKTLIEVLREARDSGVKVALSGVTIAEEDADAYDCLMNADQYLVGAYVAYMAKEWVDKTYPNAPAGSIETAIFENTLGEDSVARSKGIKTIVEPYLKNAAGEYVNMDGNAVAASARVSNPAYCPAVKIVTEVQAQMFQEGQIAMENVLTAYPNVKLVLAYASDGGCGASQVFVDHGFSRNELDNIGIFGGGAMGPETQQLKETSLGNGVFRGAVAFGGVDLPGDVAGMVYQVFNNNIPSKIIWDPISLVSAEKGEEVRVLVESTGAITPPAK